MNAFPTQRMVRGLLEEEGLAPQKRWGQNFLIDEGYARRIVGLFELPAGSRVWEIGPGVGALTGLLLNRGLAVTAFEIDWGLIRVLKRRFAEEEEFRIRPGDAVRTWKEERADTGDPGAVVGNLPYRSASAIIGALIEERYLPGPFVFTVQREVADRMLGEPGSSAYSGFSVIVQAAVRVRRAFDVPPGAFYPAPEVRSSVVVCDPLAGAEELVEEERRVLHALVRSLFRERRKVLRKTLASFLAQQEIPPAPRDADDADGAGTYASTSAEELLHACGADPGDRPENVSVEQYRRLAAAVAARSRRG